MQLTTLFVSALSIGTALAQSIVSSAASSPTGMVKVHVVRVGAQNGSLAFYPSVLQAGVGDMVQFQFAPKNHSVVQSTFDNPCVPNGGIYTGYMPVAADSEMTSTYTIPINGTAPMWLYCSQGKHCQNGMSMVINPPTANATRTLAKYQALAKNVVAAVPGDAVSGGTSGSNSTTPGTGSGSGTGSGTGSGSGAESGSGSGTSSPSPSNTTTGETGSNTTTNETGSNTTTGETGSNTTSAAGVIRAGSAMGMAALLAVGIALL